MFHYTYVIHNRLTQQFYIGVRSSKQPPHDDPYMGSSATLTLLRKQDPTAWTKYVVAEFPTRGEAMKHENELTEPAVLNTTECLNRCRGGNGWQELGTVEPWNKGKKWTEETKSKMRKPKQFISQEQYEQYCNSKRGRTPWNKGKTLAFKPISDAHRDAIKAAWAKRKNTSPQ